MENIELRERNCYKRDLGRTLDPRGVLPLASNGEIFQLIKKLLNSTLNLVFIVLTRVTKVRMGVLIQL